MRREVKRLFARFVMDLCIWSDDHIPFTHALSGRIYQKMLPMYYGGSMR